VVLRSKGSRARSCWFDRFRQAKLIYAFCSKIHMMYLPHLNME
jgi:hypothetical protein